MMKKKQNAFTLLELMVTVAVIGILTAIAAPSFKTMIANNRSATIAQELMDAINLARAEAIKRGKRVSICASSNGTSCTGTWNNGWIIFDDGAATDTATPTVTSRVQAHVGDASATISVSKNGTTQTYIRFTSLGMLARGPTDTNTLAITAQYSGCQGQSARQILIGLAGRISLSKVACT